ncbi:hypothetical protein PLICBS_003491 [Purpureocillium lilacinum]|uniref:uncharacterized protein n=1 Tax=Purpureocillium lilacinum TaxID=33203 RepID=UPI002080BE40|nr:hypothetical protein PLICBS_003491 [Purpureocillium lilacinum]
MPSATPHDKHPEILDLTIEDPGAWSSSDESGTDDEGQKHTDNREQNSAGNGSFKPADPEVPATSTTKNISKIRGDFFQNFIGSWIKAETQLKDEDFEESIRECMAIDTQSSEPTYLHSVVADRILSPDQKKFLFRIAFRLDPAQVHHTGGKEVRSALHLAALSDPQWAAKGLKSGKKHAVEEKEDPGLVPFICSLLKSTVSGTEAAAAIAVADACGDTCLHIAIRRDIVGVMDLIDLSDKTTFEKKRTGDGATLGNTPLHDALDFQWYHVQAPACKTKELLESMDIDEPTASSKSATNGGQESACKECRVRNRKYRDTKKRRRGIVGEILRSFPDALAMRNGFGLSPFLYHQLTRENTVGKLQSNGTPDLATKKEPPPTPTAVEEPRSGKVRRVPTHLVWGADSGSESVDKQPKNPKGLDKQKPKMTAPGPSSNGTTMLAPDSPHPSKKRSSGSRECHDPGTWHHLSNETMKLLIEKSFSLGGRYRDACHCLFQDRNLVTDDQGHGRRDSWEPPRRITPQTIKSYDFLKFEPMMALLRIRLTPDPWATTPLTSDRSWEVMTRDDEDALEAFFTWLKGPKGVTTILKLVVMENQDRPCSERVVRECLKGLDVRYLDWKRRDICVDTLLLRRIAISSGRGFEAEDVRKDNMKVFERRLLKWHEIKKSKIVPEISITPEPDRQDTIDTNDNMTKKNSAAQYHPWFEHIRQFTASLQGGIGQLQDDDFIKIALIDDGVDPEYENLGYFLHRCGWPPASKITYGDDGSHEGLREQCFYPGREQHGNKMAWLITQACPFVKIYVAKVDAVQNEHLPHPSFKTSEAVKAIEWATKGKKVDIISMSWNVQRNENHPDITSLLEAVRKASNANILMYCAASNTKATTKSNDPYFPGGFNEVTAIGAADWDQIRKPYVGGDADYLFPGDYVLNGPEGKPTKEGGNSAATALAAGMAALILFCIKKSGEEIRTPARTGMGKVFGDLLRVSGETVNFVDIKNLVSQNSDKSWPSHKAVVDRAQSLIAGSTESKTRKTR